MTDPVDPFDLGGKVALVTGASQGLGQRFATVLAERGAQVALAARQVEKLDALKRDIEQAGGTACARRAGRYRCRVDRGLSRASHKKTSGRSIFS